MLEGHESIVYVRIVNEDVDVWRPVAAEHIGGDSYRLLDDTPEGEEWPFGKNDVVRCEHRRLTGRIEEVVLVAAEPVSDTLPSVNAAPRIPPDGRNVIKVRFELDPSEWHGRGRTGSRTPGSSRVSVL
jgi:hypothetical protein